MLGLCLVNARGIRFHSLVMRGLCSVSHNRIRSVFDSIISVYMATYSTINTKILIRNSRYQCESSETTQSLFIESCSICQE